MKSLKYIDRINKIHSLINSEKTGTPEAFAKKLYLSRRQMYNELEFFKTLKAKIRYNTVREIFYNKGNFENHFKITLSLTIESKTPPIFPISYEKYTKSINQIDAICVQ
jgi:hypothetical protein